MGYYLHFCKNKLFYSKEDVLENDPVASDVSSGVPKTFCFYGQNQISLLYPLSDCG